MKLLCKYSGLTITVSNIPFTILEPQEFAHPIFSLPTKKILSLVPRYIDNTLGSPDDSRLLFLALLHSLELIEWRAPASALTQETIDKYLLIVADAIIKVQKYHSPNSDIFPRLVVTTNTTLSNIVTFIKELLTIAAEEHSHRYLTGKRISSKVNSRLSEEHESIFTRFINKSRTTNYPAYAARLAVWATSAADFPLTIIQDTTAPNKVISISDYWQKLIAQCGTADYINIPRGDLVDILDHISEHIEVGTIYSNSLFKLLENTIDKLDNFLGINLDAPFIILDSNSTESNSAEAAHLVTIMESAPAKEPTPKNYATKVEYLRALAAWKTAQKYLQQEPSAYNL